MQKMKLNQIVPSPTMSLDELFQKEIDIHSFEIDCSDLDAPNYNETSITYAKKILPTIHDLMKIENPSIYWFELEDESKSENVLKKFEAFRKINNVRKIPPTNIKNKGSKCLYLGVRQGGTRKDKFSFLAGRISTHFGYYKIPTTQGLNLAYWFKDKIKLHVIVLPNEAGIYLNVLEKLMAKELKPLTGKH
jgi:hypothetical protein